MPQTCPKHVPNMRQTWPKHGSNMSQTCAKHVPNMPQTCPLGACKHWKRAKIGNVQTLGACKYWERANIGRVQTWERANIRRVQRLGPCKHWERANIGSVQTLGACKTLAGATLSQRAIMRTRRGRERIAESGMLERLAEDQGAQHPTEWDVGPPSSPQHPTLKVNYVGSHHCRNSRTTIKRKDSAGQLSVLLSCIISATCAAVPHHQWENMAQEEALAKHSRR